MKIKNKDEEKSVVRFARWHNDNPGQAKEAYMTYKDIAKFINKSTSYVHKLCQKMVAESKNQDQPQRMLTRKILKQKHETPISKHHFTVGQREYLLSPKTMLKCCGMSLQERCMDFRRQYPDAHITIYKLRKLYKEVKIRKKYLRMTKLPDEPKLREIEQQAAVLGREVRFALTQGFRIVYLDEMMVTKSTLPKTEWSHKLHNYRLDLSKIDTSPVAVLCAVSREFGVDQVMLFPRAVDRMKFSQFLEALRHRFWADDIHLVMDNLAVHKSQVVTDLMDELGFGYSWTPAYSP